MSWRAFGRAESASPHGKPKRLLSPHPWRLGRLRVAGFIARVEPLAVGLGRDAGGNPVRRSRGRGPQRSQARSSASACLGEKPRRRRSAGFGPATGEHPQGGGPL
jgi:hypothetical protein